MYLYVSQSVYIYTDISAKYSSGGSKVWQFRDMRFTMLTLGDAIERAAQLSMSAPSPSITRLISASPTCS